MLYADTSHADRYPKLLQECLSVPPILVKLGFPQSRQKLPRGGLIEHDASQQDLTCFQAGRRSNDNCATQLFSGATRANAT